MCSDNAKISMLTTCCLICALLHSTVAQLEPCDISGPWSETNDPSQPFDDETNVFQFSGSPSFAFNVTNSPEKWLRWQFATGVVNFSTSVAQINFAHNPWPSGPSSSMQGTMYGVACPNISIVWENGSVWCQRSADGKCYGMPPPPPPPPNVTGIKTVHVVQSCHLDVGFANTAPGIVSALSGGHLCLCNKPLGVADEWFTHHFPMMISVAAQLRDPAVSKGTNAKLQFMAQSYLVSLYLDCPLGMALDCPSPADVAAFKAAIVRGDIYYHAFPFNSELELYSATFLQEGIALTHALDAQFGLPPKRTLSQRDVPGTTRSIIPLLQAQGVVAISVGVNGASGYPDVPSVFRWLDTPSNESLLAMWHPRGYGGITVADAVLVDGWDHALVFDWNGDNAGPYSAADYVSHFQQIQASFPNAQVVSSTFDNFTAQLATVADRLPVVSSEIGDTWIHGCPSDPRKLWTIGAFNRAWDAYLAAGGARDAVYLNATRLALKSGEHTWGLDVKSNLQDNANWANADFEFARTQGPARAQYAVLEDSWWRQRAWGIAFAIEALTPTNHPLLAYISAEMAPLQQMSTSPPPNPAAQGFIPVAHSSTSFVVQGISLAFDANTGALTTLTDLASGAVWASVSNPLFNFVYQTYSGQDFVDFIKTYSGLIDPPDWALHDFGKPNDTISTHASYGSVLQGVWTKGNTVLVTLTIASTGAVAYGTPAAIWLTLTIPEAGGLAAGLNVSVGIYNKTTTRLPEAMFCSFVPVGSDTGAWLINKMGQWINATDTVDGGSHHLHGISAKDGGVRLNVGTHALIISPIDAPIVNLGAPSAFPTPLTALPSLALGVSSLLWDNIWGTNYIMWWPFNANYAPVPEEANILFRYTLRQENGLAP